MPETYLPTREADLDEFAAMFNAKIVATPMAFGLSAPLAAAFTGLFNSWHSSYLASIDNATRTPMAIQIKKTAKQAMIDGPPGGSGIRKLVKIIQAFPALTNAQRVDLGITVRDGESGSTAPPRDAPVLAVATTLGRTVKLKLRDFNNIARRGRPEGVAGATVLMFVGEHAPLDPMQWVFAGNTSRTVVDIDFAPSIAPGAKVWMTAFWRNRRDKSGPVAVPVSTRIGDTMAMAA